MPEIPESLLGDLDGHGGARPSVHPSHYDRESVRCKRVCRAVLVTASLEVVRSGRALRWSYPNRRESRQWHDRSGLALSWPTTGRG